MKSEEAEEKIDARQWLVARVAPNTEKASRERLIELGYDAFVASQQEIRIYKNGNRKKRKKIERVVITQYVFLHLTEQERRTVVTLPFVKAFLINRSSEQRTFATVSDEQIRRLKRMLGQSEQAVQFITSGFTLGEEVIVMNLGNNDYTGRIVRVPGDNSTYVGVRLDTLGCAYLEISPENLLPVGKQDQQKNKE
ncbi:transcription termination/antitermination NusG family protein [uncultured Prevotella sp.]|uniref:transcription termination/antitermination NusG family protein n=1 Tax=uncultured Prevotella sp. TaxID=159272 RepID=UPI0025871705|nr:transcription termination/antitermination NusG family protein [uncultured Prevotella sp.]